VHCFSATMIVRESHKSRGMRRAMRRAMRCATILTRDSQDQPAKLAAAVACRSATELTVRTSQIRATARTQLRVTVPYQASPDVARRAQR
jgi:hypothetical protein